MRWLAIALILASGGARAQEFKLDLPKLPDYQTFLAPVELHVPDFDLVVAYARQRAWEGVAVPAGSVNSGRMLVSGVGSVALPRGFQIVGQRQVFPSLGISNAASVGYERALGERITIWGGVNLSDNMHRFDRFKTVGIGGQVRVKVAERVFVNGFGNYSVYNNAGALPLGMYPGRDSFGGSIELKITDGFGLEGGVIREYDPFRRRWVNQPFLVPKFY